MFNCLTQTQHKSRPQCNQINVCREIDKLFLMQTKNDAIQGADKVDKNDVTWGQANSTGMPPNPKVNKADKLTYLSTNIDSTDVSVNLSI